jgi:hypothetical protein
VVTTRKNARLHHHKTQTHTKKKIIKPEERKENWKKF